MAVVNITGRARRFMLEGGPRERKLLEFRNSRASGKDRKWVSGVYLRRTSRTIKRGLARQLRYELRYVARMATAGVELEPDTRALRPAFAWEIVQAGSASWEIV